jgi:hypothetical protein
MNERLLLPSRNLPLGYVRGMLAEERLGFEGAVTQLRHELSRQQGRRASMRLLAGSL